MKVRLFQSGDISEQGVAPAPVLGIYERDAIFVYEGTFQSMDGEVKVTADQLRKLALNHNAKWAAAELRAQAEGRAMNPADCPPVQLDHSASAKDTVGRVVGGLSVVDYTPRAGMEPVSALMGRLRFIGQENCERASDGRWTHLSVGADFDAGVLNELTVTPFPAAANAVMLKKLALDQKYRGFQIKFTVAGDGQYAVTVAGGDFGSGSLVGYCPGTNPAKGVQDAKEFIDDYLESASKSRFAEGDDMDKEKLKAHLKRKGMSEEEADKHLASCDEEKMKKLASEADEEDKKLAADEKEKADKLAADEKEKDEKLAAEEDEKKEKDAKMSSAKLGFVRLTKGMKKGFSSAKLEARKNSIAQRLSGLRAKNKLTPAEQKNIDVVKLSAKSDLEVDAFFSAFDAREGIVHLGQVGSAKAEPVAKIVSERKKLSSKQERLSSMPFTKKALGDKFSKEVEPAAPTIRMTVDQSAGDVENLNSKFASVCKMMDEGKREDALNSLKGWMETMRYASEGAAVGDESMSRMSALAEENKKLQNQFEELVTLVAPILGVESSELDA